jgi:hypothetical protein
MFEMFSRHPQMEKVCHLTATCRNIKSPKEDRSETGFVIYIKIDQFIRRFFATSFITTEKIM